jgi:ABC-type polysaccharide/polyol phosphate export permease
MSIIAAILVCLAIGAIIVLLGRIPAPWSWIIALVLIVLLALFVFNTVSGGNIGLGTRIG